MQWLQGKGQKDNSNNGLQNITQKTWDELGCFGRTLRDIYIYTTCRYIYIRLKIKPNSVRIRF
jgi:hypothetical protein